MTDQTSPSADYPGRAAAGHTPAQPPAYTTNQVPAPSTDPWATTRQVPAQPTNGPATSGMSVSDTTDQQPPGYYPAYATATPPYPADPAYVQFGDDTSKPRRGRRRTVLISSVIVAVLAIGVGAYAGVRAWTGSGIAEPETAVPASVTAFARIDLNPGIGDKLSVDGLVKKFPTHGKSASELIAKLEASISKSANLDFNTDVKPWFGGQAGLGLWTNESRPVGLIALSSKDDAKAKAAMSKLRANADESFGYAMEKGYALIAVGGSGQADATAAAKAAEQSPLANDSTFKSTVAHVGNDNLLLAYADLDKVTSLLAPMLSTLGGSGLGSEGGGLFGGFGLPGASKAAGRFALGGKVMGDGVELRVHVDSAAFKTSGTKIMPTLNGLPSATVVGGAFGGVDPSSDVAKMLNQLLGQIGNGSVTGSPIGGSDFGPLLSDGLTKLLTSKQLSFALTGQATDGEPGILINVDARDAASAASIVDDFNKLAKNDMPPGFNISQNGASIKATIGSPASGGSLGSSNLFKETMNGMSDSTAAFYVDMQRLVAFAGRDMPADARAYLAPIKSIGLGSSGSDLVLRVVIK